MCFISCIFSFTDVCLNLLNFQNVCIAGASVYCTSGKDKVCRLFPVKIFPGLCKIMLEHGSMESNLPHRIGVTPQLKLSLRQPLSEYVIPRISTGQRNLLTILAVCPDRLFTMINFAFKSVAIAQVEWETASRLLVIANSAFLKRFS